MTTPPVREKKTVLVIDDERSITAYLTTLLEDEGYEVYCATDAESAVETARQRLPDLITLDVMMPRRSGLRLYQELKLDPQLRDIPVVFVSAFSRTSSVGPDYFRKLIPDERVPVPEVYFEKPVVVPKFLETVAALVAARGSSPRAAGEQTP